MYYMIDFDDIKIQREYEHKNIVFVDHRALRSERLTLILLT